MISALMPFALRLCEALDAETLQVLRRCAIPMHQQIAQQCGLDCGGSAGCQC